MRCRTSPWVPEDLITNCFLPPMSLWGKSVDLKRQSEINDYYQLSYGTCILTVFPSEIETYNAEVLLNNFYSTTLFRDLPNIYWFAATNFCEQDVE